MTRPALTKTAIEEPVTAAGQRRRHQRARRWSAGMCVATVAGMTVGVLIHPSDASPPMIVMSFLLGTLAIWFASLGLFSARRAERILRAHPWRPVPCEYVVHTGSSTTWQLRAQLSEEGELLLQPVPYDCNLHKRAGDYRTTIWYAGPPTGKGVVSPVGGHFPVRVIPIPEPQGRSRPN